jgi:uncharacterized protein (TIGR03437 family)
MANGDAQVTLTNASGATLSTTTRIAPVTPGFFTLNGQGTGTPAAIGIRVAPDLSQSVVAVFECSATACAAAPIDLSVPGEVYLELYGTGIRKRSALTAVRCTIGGVDAPVIFAGAQPTFPGEDQMDMLIPASLRGRGEVPVACTVDGQNANTVTINIR